jgi:putative DNA primase/helicase
MYEPSADRIGDGEQFAAPRLFESTDLGNARRLVAAHGSDLRHIPEQGRWIVWNGSRWAVDITGEVQRRAKAVTEAILDEARANPDNHLFKWGLRSQSASSLRASVAVAETEPGVPVLIDHLDAHPYLLTVANGTLDLRTGALRPARRSDLITKASPVQWEQDATAPSFVRFLDEVVPDPEVRDFLQVAIGYTLTGDVSEHCLFFAHGDGANGKSTLMNVLADLLGDLASPGAPQLLVLGKHAEHPTQVADLFGRRLVVCQEIGEGHHLDEALVKQLTGGDPIMARYMRQDFWSFTPTHKLWLCANHKPTIRGTDLAIWRRLCLIPFDVTIPPERRDRHLGERLRAELPGILRWAVDGCLRWQAEGLKPPTAVVAATNAYRRDQDTIGQFLADCCILNPTAKAKSAQLYEAYQRWCARVGLMYPLSQKAVAPRLKEHGLAPGEGRHAWWVGVGLKTEEGD